MERYISEVELKAAIDLVTRITQFYCRDNHNPNQVCDEYRRQLKEYLKIK